MAEIGETAGSMGGVAAAALVPITMGANPIFGVAAAAVSAGHGILPGFIAVTLGIINNAPGTASPLPGLLAPFAFNDPQTVLIAAAGAALSGIACGLVGTQLISSTKVGRFLLEKTCQTT